MRMRRAQFIANGGILAAVSLALLLLASVLPSGRLAVCAAAGILPAIPLCRQNVRLGIMIGAVTTVLGAVFVPRKGLVFLYTVFALYTFVKYVVERSHHRILEWIGKMAYCNAVAGVAWLLLRAGLLPQINTTLGMEIAGLLLFNIIFIVYDIAFSQLIGLFSRILPKQ